MTSLFSVFALNEKIQKTNNYIFTEGGKKTSKSDNCFRFKKLSDIL